MKYCFEAELVVSGGAAQFRYSHPKSLRQKNQKKNQSFEKYPDFSISNMNIAKEK